MDTRTLASLRSVGPATRRDLHNLGIDSVELLAQQNPLDLYEKLQDLVGLPVDICMLDVFACAVAQARDPHMPREQCDWFWWSKERKADFENGAYAQFLRAAQPTHRAGDRAAACAGVKHNV